MGAYGSLQLSIQPWICAPGTHYGWVDRGSVVYEVCPTLLHMASTGNRTPDLLILSPTPYPLGHMLPQCSETQISLMLFPWEHLKYQNSHPGAHFGTGLGEPWGGCSEPEISFRAIWFVWFGFVLFNDTWSQ